MKENKNIDHKSLRFLKGAKPDWDELAKDGVCFANGSGGVILIGIEDGVNCLLYIKKQKTEIHLI